MKTVLHNTRNFLTPVFAAVLGLFSVNSSAQTTEMVFENPSLVSGSNNADGAVYKFASVSPGKDALVTINGRSSSMVSIANLDIHGQGFNKAFQPQIRYNNGNVSTATSWWIEFQVQFVNANTQTPASISEFHVTGLDIDGNGSRLQEWDAFYGGHTYTVENNSALTPANLTGTLNLPTLGGKRFLGCLPDHGGIDTSATEIMTTVQYVNTSSMIFRLGATTTGSVTNANRMYSVWFKNFAYAAPISTLPVKLTAFTASLNKNTVNLKWETASEINVSHFEIERSTDGVNFSEAGLVFAFGNSTDKMNYSFSDNVSALRQPVVYYRLRSVDNDGKNELSETRIIRLAAEENTLSLLTYPNPVQNELRVTLPASWQNKPVQIEIYQTNGQSAARKSSQSASQTETLNLSQLSPGIYFVRASSNGQIAQQKIVKH